MTQGSAGSGLQTLSAALRFWPWVLRGPRGPSPSQIPASRGSRSPPQELGLLAVVAYGASQELCVRFTHFLRFPVGSHGQSQVVSEFQDAHTLVLPFSGRVLGSLIRSSYDSASGPPPCPVPGALLLELAALQPQLTAGLHCQQPVLLGTTVPSIPCC